MKRRKIIPKYPTESSSRENGKRIVSLDEENPHRKYCM